MSTHTATDHTADNSKENYARICASLDEIERKVANLDVFTIAEPLAHIHLVDPITEGMLRYYIAHCAFAECINIAYREQLVADAEYETCKIYCKQMDRVADTIHAALLRALGCAFDQERFEQFRNRARTDHATPHLRSPNYTACTTRDIEQDINTQQALLEHCTELGRIIGADSVPATLPVYDARHNTEGA